MFMVSRMLRCMYSVGIVKCLKNIIANVAGVYLLRMKILQVVPTFRRDLGGTVAVVRTLSKQLARDHEVTVCTTTAKTASEDMMSHPIMVARDGYRVLAFPRNFKQSGFSISVPMLRSYKEIIMEHDIIHIHSWRQFHDLVTYRYASSLGVPYMIQTHGSLPRILAHRFMKLLFDYTVGEKILKNATRVLASNRMEEIQYRNEGVAREKVSIIPNGIDISSYSIPNRSHKEILEEFGIHPRNRVILYLGRLHKSKGLGLLVDAFSKLTKHRRDLTLLMIGPDDGYGREIVTRTQELGIRSNIKIIGFVSEEMKLAALSQSDVFVTPTYEAFPNTFLEACLCGCPIVTTKPDLSWIDGNVGIVTKPNPQSLAESISQIIDNDEVRFRLKENCIETIKKFDIRQVTESLVNLYRMAIKESKGFL